MGGIEGWDGRTPGPGSRKVQKHTARELLRFERAVMHAFHAV